jgi:hypothetical protein
MLQRLIVGLVETGRHRLHRFTPSVQHQPCQVAVATLLPALTLQRHEHVLDEILQISVQPQQTLNIHTQPTTDPSNHDAIMTEHY